MASILNSIKILADPTRLRLLLLLEKAELTVAELQEILGMGQSRISTHLAQLKRASLVADRRAGKNIYYGPGVDDQQPEIQSLIRACSGEIPQVAADARALEHVLRKRQDTTRDYFNKLAGKLGRSSCPGRSWEGLAHLLLLELPSLTVADLGAGEGTISQLLAQRVAKVIAIDNSEKMVEYGSNLAREHGFTNLEYRHGDIEDPPIDAASIDLAIFSQALHHASQPQRALQAAARILKPGGRLVILDLLEHQFEQARELYADLWLGFSEVTLHHWLEQGGFREVEVRVVSREPDAPYFQTLLATGVK